jgi:hypothetical protein
MDPRVEMPQRDDPQRAEECALDAEQLPNRCFSTRLLVPASTPTSIAASTSGIPAAVTARIAAECPG